VRELGEESGKEKEIKREVNKREKGKEKNQTRSECVGFTASRKAKTGSPQLRWLELSAGTADINVTKERTISWYVFKEKCATFPEAQQ
jgi:hypothetical protein